MLVDGEGIVKKKWFGPKIIKFDEKYLFKIFLIYRI